MSLEENKELVRRVVEEIVNKGNLDEVDRLFDPNFFDPDVPAGVESYKSFIMRLHKMFGELHYSIQDIVAEGDRVAVRLAGKGTHTGNFLGIPPTGKKLKFWVLALFRLRNGKVLEHWALLDSPGILKQLRER